MDKVSIGIPVYNEEDNILQLLKSLKNQKQILIDSIFIYNDGSSDLTDEIIKNYITLDLFAAKHITYISAIENLGKSAALKEIFKRNNSKFLVIIDSDMLLTDELTIFKLIQPLKENSSIGLVNGWYYYKKGASITQQVLEFSSDLLKYIGKFQPLYVCSGAIMGLSLCNIEKINIPTQLTRIDAFLYFITKKNGFGYKFCESIKVLDKKNFDSLSLKWFIRIQKRVHSYPPIFKKIFSQSEIENSSKISFTIKLKSFLIILLKFPLKGFYYFIYKLAAQISSHKAHKIDFLWRR